MPDRPVSVREHRAMRPYVALFYLWLAVSIVILVYRRVRPKADAGPEASPSSGVPSLADILPPPDLGPQPIGAVDVDVDHRSGPPPADAGDVAAPPASSVPLTRPDASLPRPGVPPAGRASLPELLGGIAMPADLAPLTHLGPASLDHLVLVTTTAPLDTVTRGLDEELTRLGYGVAWSGWGLGRATGPRGVVELAVHDGGAVSPEGTVRFPTAPPGSVVVELRPG